MQTPRDAVTPVPSPDTPSASAAPPDPGGSRASDDIPEFAAFSAPAEASPSPDTEDAPPPSLRQRLTQAWWRHLPSLFPNFLCFFSSMAIMVLELVAGRLVANSVGSSQYTWTSIIAVILAGMSLGNWWGGRLADRPDPLIQLERLFLGAALSVQLCLPLSWLLSLVRDSALPLVLHHPEGSSHLWGLAVCTMMAGVFLLPAVALGILSPVIARLALDAHRQTGRAIGSVYSWGAIGSILGVMGSGFVLVSLLPVKVILGGVSVAMVLLSGLVWLYRRSLLPTLLARQAALAADAQEPASEIPAATDSAPAGSADVSTDTPSYWLHPYAIITLSSFTLMVIEMIAARFVSRNVGSSIYTWTIVIGVIFAGMSLGNYLGGRLAAKPPFGWSLSRLTSRLLLLASLLTFVVIWTAPQIDRVMRPLEWPGGGHYLDAQLGYPPRALSTLRELRVPEAVLKTLQTTSFQEYSEDILKQKLRATFDATTFQQYGPVLIEQARLMGPTATSLREEGLPDEVLEGMRPSINRPFLRGLEYELEARLTDTDRLEGYSKDERYGFLTTLQARTWRFSLFVFPVRLLVMVLLVFLGPALALGCVSPVVAAMALSLARARGRTMGNVYAWGAWGSILGTGLAGFFLIRWFGCSFLTGLAALLLALLALKPDRVSWLSGVWTGLLLVLLFPLLGQRLEPNALDHLPYPHFNKSAYRPHNPISALAHALNEGIYTADDDVGPSSIESNYQSLQVSYASMTPERPDRELRKLRLDRLIHGYLLLKMPRKDQAFEYDQSEFDPSHLIYDYEMAYALATGRSQFPRFKPDPEVPGHWLAPSLMSLSLGGGTYTFPRFLLARWQGNVHTVKAGETLEGLLSHYYLDTELETRPNPTLSTGTLSTGTLSTGTRESLQELAERVMRAQKLPEAPPGLKAPANPAALTPGTQLWFPSLADVVELDPLVTEINYQRLRLKRFEEDSRLKTWNYDARNFVDALNSGGWTGRYDVIFGDAFNHYSVPYHLSTVEFNQKVKQLLKPGGVFIANLIDRYGRVRFLSAYLTTLKHIYRHVLVVVEKDRALRHGRETFVIVASDAPVPLDFGGGVPASALPFLEKGDLDGLQTELMKDDPVLGTQLSRARKAGVADLPAQIIKKMQIDLQQVDLQSNAEALTQYEADKVDALRIRRYVPYDEEEATRELIEVGRMPTLGRFFRELLPIRLLSPISRFHFEINELGLKRLQQTECPDDLVTVIAGLQGKTFDDVEALLDAIAAQPSPPNNPLHLLLAKNQHLIVRSFRVRPPARPPLVLSDAYAPADELLAPLFEDPSTY